MLINKMAYKFISYLKALREGFVIINESRRLMNDVKHGTPVFSTYHNLIQKYPSFIPQQNKSEMGRLFQKISETKCSDFCEIGNFHGGTLFYLCRAAVENARIISIDIRMSRFRKIAYRHFGKPGQRLYCFEADSKSIMTRKKVARLLGSRQLDFLLIDGDHSYEGVKSDFEHYSPFVRKGGLIAFHDIQPLGPDAPEFYFVGGVPKFWKEINDYFAHTEEYIDNPDQNGFGIGIIVWH